VKKKKNKSFIYKHLFLINPLCTRALTAIPPRATHQSDEKNLFLRFEKDERKKNGKIIFTRISLCSISI